MFGLGPVKLTLIASGFNCPPLAAQNQYGHKVNLATEQHGFITHFNIEDGNSADATLYRPVLDVCQADYQSTPESVVADAAMPATIMFARHPSVG